MAPDERTAIIVDAVTRTLETFTNTKLTRSATAPGETPSGDIAAASVIRYEGHAGAYELFLAFPLPALQLLAQNTLGSSGDDTGLSADLVGEVLNIAFGHIDPQLAGRGMKLRSSFPHNFTAKKLSDLRATLPPTALRTDFKAFGNDFSLCLFEGGAIRAPWAYSAKKPTA